MGSIINERVYRKKKCKCLLNSVECSGHTFLLFVGQKSGTGEAGGFGGQRGSRRKVKGHVERK